MLNRTMTRRAAIGLAILGVNAAVLMGLRSWRKRPPVKTLNLGGFYSDWENLVQRLNVPITRINAPTKFTLKYMPDAATALNAVVATYSYGPELSNFSYPHVPSFFIYSEGVFRYSPPLIDQQPAVSIVAGKYTKAFPDNFGTEPGGSCVAVVDEQSADCDINYYDPASPRPTLRPAYEVDAACWQLGKTLKRSFSNNTEYEIGSEWTVPAGVHGFDFRARITEIVKIAKRTAARIDATRRLTPAEVGQYTDWLTRQQGKRTPPHLRQSSAQIEQELQLELDKILSSNETREYRLTEFIDIESGVTLRRELVGKISLDKQPPTVGGTISYMEVL